MDTLDYIEHLLTDYLAVYSQSVYEGHADFADFAVNQIASLQEWKSVIQEELYGTANG